MKAMETTAYYAFGVPLYLLITWVEARRAKARGMPTVTLPEGVGNVSTGVGTIVLGLFLGPALILLYDWGYRHLALVHWPDNAWQTWLLALILADFGHYCHHWFDHHVAVCWSVHGVHHQPEQMNYTVAMRHAWFSDLYSFPFYIWLPLLGVPTTQFFIATTILSVHALITHSEQFRFPGFGIFVTPQSHILHHAKNPRYLDRNYGAMFCLWDRMFRTQVTLDPADPPQYGAKNGYETHDGVKSQFVLLRDLLRLAKQGKTWQQRLKAVVGRPGWSPAGIAVPRAASPPSTHQISQRTKMYILAQFALTLLFALFIFIPRDDYSWEWKLVSAILILAALSSLGGLLDGRRLAWRVEAGRCVITLVALLGFYLIYQDSSWLAFIDIEHMQWSIG